MKPQKKYRLERHLEAACVQWAARHGILHVKLNVAGSRGWPDRIFFHQGPKFVEFKKLDTFPSPAQLALHKKMWMADCPVYIVKSLPEFVELMQ